MSSLLGDDHAPVFAGKSRQCSLGVNDECSEPISKLTAKLSRHAAQIEVEIHG